MYLNSIQKLFLAETGTVRAFKITPNLLEKAEERGR